jgi:hypothetical protein
VRFHDAILFDMMVDLAIGDLQEHTRSIADAPSIQLEILEALEQEQLKIEAAAGIGPSSISCSCYQKLY